jgi:hypothetical protein
LSNLAAGYDKFAFVRVKMHPAGTDSWTEDQLAAIVIRDTMIGVAVPSAEGGLR